MVVTVTLADAGSVDERVRFALFAEIKTDELALAAWDPEARQQLLRMQFDAQRRGYRAQWPELIEQVIVRDGEAAGWVTIGDDGAALCCVDIAIRPQARGAGLGTAVLRELQERAAALDRPLVLSVWRDNARAQALYARLGFREISVSDTHVHMEWRPA